MTRTAAAAAAAVTTALVALVLDSIALPLHAQARRQRPAAKPAAVTAAPQTSDSAPFTQLKYRYIGPVGNRVSAVAGVAGDPNTYYAGAASGGIWKTTDGGIHWQPIFDDQPVQSIGALAVAPSDPNVVWAGSGEAWIRSHISIGNGIYKSTDAGKTWQHMGLENTGRIARVVVHPTNPDVVYVAALGHSYGPQQERGVYRTTDGGKTWERVLFVDENTGASDVVMDPSNPRILFAGMWQIVIHTWGRESGGPGSGIYQSTDGGTTWKRLTGNGLPTHPFGKVGLAIAHSNPARVYALIETGDGVPNTVTAESDRGELWRSDDGGENWRVVSYDRQLACRQPYYTRMAVAPDRENEAYFLCASFSKTLDGGQTTVDVPFPQSPGGDNHDMWIDPGNGDRMVVGNDGQVSISTNRGRSWYRQQLPIAQMYHATVDNQIPYYVMGNRQDGPSSRGPSNSKIGGFGGGGGGAGVIPRGDWHSVGGGESGWATPDPTDPNVIWSSASGSGSVGGIVVRYDERTRQAQDVEIWPQSTIGAAAGDVKYRFVWTAPLTISPHDHNTIYFGSQFVHMTKDGGKSWQVISPDLTLNDKSKQQISGGLTPDNIGVEYGDVVFAIAESPLKAGLIWAGTNDGVVQVTRDGGKNWTNVTSAIPGMPAWGTVSNIEPSRYDTATAYITVDGHQANNRDPFVYKTTDYGRSWKAIVTGLPRTPMGYAHVVREDPVRRGLLYLGTESGLYASFDDGDSWQSLQSNLPHAPVYWLVIQEHFNDLVVSTYGRGFWILDDITPLQQLGADVRGGAAYLFKPRPAYRFRQNTPPFAMTDDPTAGQNPPYGAALNYWVKSAQTDSAAITIVDAGGQTVRTFKGPAKAGVNRAWWDLRGEQTKEARLRTSPTYAPDIRPGPEGWRPAPGIGRLALLVAPGTYNVKVKVGGQEFSQPLVVRKDPNSGGSEEEIGTQSKLLAGLQTDLNQAVDAINQVEAIRSQLQALQAVLPAVKPAADSLERKFADVEDQLQNLRYTGRGQDDVRWPTRLAGQIEYLAQGVAGSDFAPTSQQVEVARVLEDQLKGARTRVDGLVSQDLAKFNEQLRQRNVGNVVAAGGGTN
jgi:photosystem II stability/assembly factor-like uncharacterized protein